MDRIEREQMARHWLAANLRWSASIERCRAADRASGCVVALARRDADAVCAPARPVPEHRVA